MTLQRDVYRFSVLCVLAIALAVCGTWLADTQAQQTTQGETISRCGTAAPSAVVVNTATLGNVELVALSSGKRVYVCGFTLDNDTATTALQFIYGTGTACATGETDLTGAMTVASLSLPNAGASQFATAASNALCIELSAATQVNGVVTYVQH